MADQVEVKIGGKSQEEIALAITDRILHMKDQLGDADALLDTYKKVLKVVRNPFTG